MTVNLTKIEWTDATWNPASGCLHDKLGICKLPCYARAKAENPFYRKAFPNKFKPTFYPERLLDPVKQKQPRTIFVCSMGDMFGRWVPEGWLIEVFDAIKAAPQHTYCLLTKNPERMYAWSRQDWLNEHDNVWWGTTVTGVEDTERIGQLQDLESDNLFISFEPLLAVPSELYLDCIKGVIIGAQTKPLILPPEEAITAVEFAAKDSNIDTKVFYKNSIIDNYSKERKFSRELPWNLYTKEATR
jgi:protein gp37